MNEKMKERYEWTAEHPLTKRILGYIREAGEDAEPDHISQMVMDDMISKIELTDVTAPFVIFCLRDLVDATVARMSEEEIAILRVLEAEVKHIGVTVRAPLTLDPDDDKDESEKK